MTSMVEKFVNATSGIDTKKAVMSCFLASNLTAMAPAIVADKKKDIVISILFNSKAFESWLAWMELIVVVGEPARDWVQAENNPRAAINTPNRPENVETGERFISLMMLFFSGIYFILPNVAFRSLCDCQSQLRVE